jgi:sugar (pentulose or hexulose) kinase
MSDKSHIAIFDIGKTNKKLFLLDEAYNIVYERSEQFEEITDDDGEACEDVTALTNWVYNSFEVLQREMPVRWLNFSGYGASFVHMGKAGLPVAALYNYLKPYPEKLQKQFYGAYGGTAAFSMETASPVLGNLNSGLLLYFLKYAKPELYDDIQCSLHLPQYLSYLFSKKYCSDLTSIGCHTGLWSFSKSTYHNWVYAEGIDKKLAPVYPSDKPLQAIHNEKSLHLGIGLHDSSAALIPYLRLCTTPFVLLSTGTWCISLNPFNQDLLTEEELQQDCLCYMEYQGKAVKAARLFAGYEHEQQTARLAGHFNMQQQFYKTVQFDKELVGTLLERIPAMQAGHAVGAMQKQSVFENRPLDLFSNYEQAYHQLMIDLVRQQIKSTALVLNNTGVKKLFVDGGFSNNSIFMNLLAAGFPQMEVYGSSVAQASAIGAAMALHSDWNSNSLPVSIIELKAYATPDNIQLLK